MREKEGNVIKNFIKRGNNMYKENEITISRDLVDEFIEKLDPIINDGNDVQENCVAIVCAILDMTGLVVDLPEQYTDDSGYTNNGGQTLQ